MTRSKAAPLTRDLFLELCEAGNRQRSYVRHREGRVDVYLPGVYRMFASWVEAGPQAGAHLRGAEGPRSTAFRGDHNWVHGGALDRAAMERAIAESRRIAAMRGGGHATSGELPDVYKPLLHALKAMQAPPAGLHAGGPRAKVLSGEQELATKLCERCMERTRHLTQPGDDDLLKRLDKLRAQKSIKYEVLWPAANALPYGTDSAKRAADEAESAAVQTTRAVLGCRYGSQKCLPFVTKALVRTVREIESSDGAAAAAALVVELDELIMNEELVAALAARAKQEAPAFERVLWRGADAKGYPAWWLVRIDGERYGLLGKLGRRWQWSVADWDSVVAMIPDEHFEEAVEAACARDGRA